MIESNSSQQFYGLVGNGMGIHMVVVKATDEGTLAASVVCGAEGAITLLPVTGSDGGAWCVRCVRAQLAQ